MFFLFRMPPRQRKLDLNDDRDAQWASRVGMAGSNRNQRGGGSARGGGAHGGAPGGFSGCTYYRP